VKCNLTIWRKCSLTQHKQECKLIRTGAKIKLSTVIRPNYKWKLDSTDKKNLRTLLCVCRWLHKNYGTRSGSVGWGTVLQAGRSQFRLPMVPVEFAIDLILQAALWPWDRLSLTEMSTRTGIFPGGQTQSVPGADYLTTFMFWHSGNLGDSTP